MSHTIQSEDYVPDVSGWKIDTETGAFELASERVTVSGADPKALYSGKSLKERQKQYIIVDGVTYISEAFVDDASIKKAKITNDQLASMWSFKVEVGPGGKRYAAGFDLGINSQYIVDADRFAVNGRDASEILRDISSQIDETALGKELKERIEQLDGSVADKIRDVIRSEMRQGGLLWRSH